MSNSAYIAHKQLFSHLFLYLACSKLAINCFYIWTNRHIASPPQMRIVLPPTAKIHRGHNVPPWYLDLQRSLVWIGLRFIFLNSAKQKTEAHNQAVLAKFYDRLVGGTLSPLAYLGLNEKKKSLLTI